MRHGLFFPTNAQIDAHIIENGTQTGVTTDDHGSYILADGIVRNAYQRNETIIRTVYDLDSYEYARLEIRSKDG